MRYKSKMTMNDAPPMENLPSDIIQIPLGFSGDSMGGNSSDPRALYLDGEINPDTVFTIIQSIHSLNYEDDRKEREYALDLQTYVRPPIKLYLNSPGGHVTSGLGLIGVMLASKTPIHTYAYDTVASMGFVVAICGHRRFAYKHTTFMYHSISGGAIGTLADMYESVEEATRIQSKSDAVVIAHTDLTQEKLIEISKRKFDWYFDEDEALSLKCIDEIL